MFVSCRFLRAFVSGSFLMRKDFFFWTSALLLAFCATWVQAAESVLYDWEFNTPGDFEGWKPGGGMKDVSAADGVLKGTFTGNDPILFCPPVEFATRKGQFFEIRIKMPFDTQGELYFSNTHEGRFGGFSGEKMKLWKLRGDGNFHTYRFLPGWFSEGKIIQLRLDPGTPKTEHFGTTSFEIDYVKIIDLNYDSISEMVPDWDFTKPETVKNFWKPAGATAENTSEGLKLTYVPENEQLLGVARLESGPVRNSDAAFGSWCVLEMSVEHGVAGRLFVTTDALKEPIEVPIALQADGKMHLYNIPVAAPGFDPREVHFLTLEMSDAVDANAVVKSIYFAREPQGPAQLKLQDGGGLTDAVVRAGRNLEFEFCLSNTGGKCAENLRTAKIELPQGVSVVRSNFEPAKNLDSFSNTTYSMQLFSKNAVSGTAKITMNFETKNSSNSKTVMYNNQSTPQTCVFEFPIEILPSLNLPRASYVPEPQPVKSEYEIGALYFPGWGTPAAWERIFPVAPIRKPVLGWYDEANPECIDWQIKWAVENGIQYFLVDWYWSKGHQHLDHWVNSFQKARYKSYFKWAMMWANHNGPGSHSEEDQAAVTKFWIENYFNTPEYYTIDGRPVVMIWSPEGMDADVRAIYAKKGVELKRGEGVKKLLDLSQKMAKDAGFKGIYFIAMKWPEAQTNAETVQWLADAGFEMTSIYHYMHHGNKAPNPKYFSFDYCVDSIGPYWESRQETGILPFLPNLSTGWDSRPWHGLRQTVIYDRTPEKFRKICEICKDFTQKNGIRNIILAPLNEWGEGSYAEPNKEFGFGMYEAVRETFCEKPAAGWPLNYTPADVGLGPYDMKFPHADENAVMNQTFDGDATPENTVWTALMGVSEPKQKDGTLVFTTTSRDPALKGSFPAFFANRCTKITVRMKLTAAEKTNSNDSTSDSATKTASDSASDTAQLFWGTPMYPISETTTYRAPVFIDGEFHEYTFPVGGSPFWQGKIEALRFDPCSASGIQVEIDSILLLKD